MHYIIDEIRIIWVPLQLRLRGAGGGEHRKCKIYGDLPPKWVNSTQKICKHGSHFDPHASKKKKKKKIHILLRKEGPPPCDHQKSYISVNLDQKGTEIMKLCIVSSQNTKFS